MVPQNLFQLSQVTFPLKAVAVKSFSFPLTGKPASQKLFIPILTKQISNESKLYFFPGKRKRKLVLSNQLTLSVL